VIIFLKWKEALCYCRYAVVISISSSIIRNLGVSDKK
jgi:hypothetical protein